EPGSDEVVGSASELTLERAKNRFAVHAGSLARGDSTVTVRIVTSSIAAAVEIAGSNRQTARRASASPGRDGIFTRASASTPTNEAGRIDMSTMKEMSAARPIHAQMLDLITGYWVSCAVHVAARLSIADQLAR